MSSKKPEKLTFRAPCAAAAVIAAVQFFALHSATAQTTAQSGANQGWVAMQQSPANPAPASATSMVCTAPAALTHFERPLVHMMRSLTNGQPLTIVAIGSSSTAGAGASSPDASYPSRLAVDLRARFPGREITVINRGVNGEETTNMMARFAPDVLAAHPQLVLWQIGTNSVLRDHPLSPHALQLHAGIERLKAAGADVVLIDPQFAPAVLAKSETQGMVEQIALAAKQDDVALFQRFAVMRDWHDVQHLAFDSFVSPDHLHMNDWSYACLAKLLGGAIAEAATRPIAAAAIHSDPMAIKPAIH
jgi:lysophospholipase L1-like esterase